MDEKNADHQTLLRIATAAAWLLNNIVTGNELKDLQKRYVCCATDQGYITASGHIRWKLLLPEFNRCYSKSLLDMLQSPLVAGNNDHWLARILRKPRAVQAPIRHLLLMDFLNLTPETFFRMKAASQPFGDGP